MWLAAARTSVLPSGALFATEPVPIVPPAPARFSTITVRPRSAPSSALNERATMSCTPPAAKGTTIWITGCAFATVAASASSNATRPLTAGTSP